MVVGSALAHAGALGLVLAAPSGSDQAPPRVISVELIAPSPAAAPAARKPASAPAPVPAAKPPPPKPKQVVLPEKPQAPKPQSKPKPREPDVFKEPEKKQEKSLEELLEEMRGDAAETPTAPGPTEPAMAAIAPSPGSSEGRGALSAEERDWQARVIRRMKGIWVVPPGFRTQPLQTRVVVTLDAAGNILGTPRITQRSGNPWYDDGVVRGLGKASPLPPPPEAGDWTMWFEPGDSL